MLQLARLHASVLGSVRDVPAGRAFTNGKHLELRRPFACSKRESTPQEWFCPWATRYELVSIDDGEYQALIERHKTFTADDFIRIGKWKDGATVVRVGTSQKQGSTLSPKSRTVALSTLKNTAFLLLFCGAAMAQTRDPRVDELNNRRNTAADAFNRY